MALSYQTDSAVLIIPGSYVSIKVAGSASGLATTGVIMLVGEADAGPDFSQETELGDNAFGPNSLGDVIAKYKSGNLVDAFKIAATPANDPDITGSPNRFIIVKTNVSAKASAILNKIGGGTYATLYDKSSGSLGNLIYFTVSAKQAEILPTTSAFTYIPAVDTVNANLRVNGGAALALALPANTTPAALVTALNLLSGVSATGGISRAFIIAAGTLTVAASSNNITLTRSVNWSVLPVLGDTLVIPAASVIVGAANANAGSYVITAVSAASLTATKLSDAGKPGAVVGAITAPANVAPQAISGTPANDAVAYSPVTITLSGATVVDGLGKTLEINELTTGLDLLSRTAFVLGTTGAVTWVSKTGGAKLLVSGAEYAVNLNVNRQADNIQEVLSAGGQIALKIGYTGTTCSVVVGATTMVLTALGGANAGVLTINLKQYPTLSDLATYINAQSGYTAAVGTTALGQYSPLGLDEGTFDAGTTWGSQTMSLKVDATKFFSAVSGSSALVTQGNPAVTAAAGLPDLMPTTTYLAGGAKGGTTDAGYDAAVDGLKNVKGNFVVPLFARDAASDITDGLTESTSTYTIANVQAYTKSHVLAMSTLKRRKNRQAFLANRGTYAAAAAAAANIASFRCDLAFQDVKATGSNGIVQYQPWMLAALAAGMQAAGFYRSLMHKGINCNGVLQAAGDWKDSNQDNEEDALVAGLLIAQKADGGGYQWVSDQTTYAKDNNFFFNSTQMVYAGDVIALTTAQRMEKAFVGQSIADVSATLALTALEGIMGDYMRLKLIAPSDDALKGFKNASIKIKGFVMEVSAEVKIAGAIAFIPISFLVTQVTQSASS